jgi:subtilisin family serine protease
MFLNFRRAACVGVIATVSLLPSFVQTQSARSLTRENVDGHWAVAGEALVRFKDGGKAPNDALAAGDVDEEQPIGQSGWRRLRSRSKVARLLIQTLRSRGDVVEVEPNYIVEAEATPNDPLFPNLWGLKNAAQAGADIHATAAWDITSGGVSNVIAVVDSGVDYTHPDLVSNMWSAPTAFTVTVGGRSITCPAGSHGFNAIAFTCNPMDDLYHGTHVAGTIGAVGNNALGVVGVNWTTRIMALKFLDSTGTGSDADAINAIEFALQCEGQVFINERRKCSRFFQ